MCPASIAAPLEVSLIVNLILNLDLPVSFTPDSLLSWWWPWQPLPPPLSFSLSLSCFLSSDGLITLKGARLSRRYLMADRPQHPVGLIINVLSRLSISSRWRGYRARHTYTYSSTHTQIQICAHACGYMLTYSQSHAKEPIQWHILEYPYYFFIIRHTYTHAHIHLL